MKKLLLLSYIFGSTIAYSQSFYVKPLLNNKWNFSNSKIIGIKQPNEYSDNYFTFTNENNLFSGNVGLGLAAGVYLKRGRKVELGWVQDFVGNGSYYTIFHKVDISLNESQQYSKGYGEVRLQTLNKLFIQLYEPITMNSKTNIIYGLSVGKVGRVTGYNMEGDDRIYEVDSNLVVEVYSRVAAYNKLNLYGMIGLEHDFKYKSKYLFSVSAVLNMSLTKNILHEQYTSINVVDNGVKHYRHFSYHSKGSGVLFTVSRRLSLKFIQKPKNNGNEIFK